MWIGKVWVEREYSQDPNGVTVATDMAAGHPRVSITQVDGELIIDLVDGIDRIKIKDPTSREIEIPGPWVLINDHMDLMYLEASACGCTRWTKKITKAACWDNEGLAEDYARSHSLFSHVKAKRIGS